MRSGLERFSQCAFSAMICDTAFVAIAGAILMFAFSFNLRLALTLGAGVSLAFCLRLIYRWSQLQKKGVCQTEIWQIMEPDELPREAPAIRGAQDRMEELLLRFAKGAAGVTVALAGPAFLMSLN